MKFATKLSLGCIALLSCALGAAGLLLTGQSFSGSLTSTRTALQAQQDKEKYALERIIFQATDSAQFENYILASAAQQYAEQTADAGSSMALWLDGAYALYSGLPAALPRTALKQALTNGENAWQLTRAAGRWYLLLTQPLDLPGVRADMLCAYDVSAVFATRDAQLRAWLAASAALLVLGGGAAVLFSRRVTRPLTALQTASEKIADGEYTQRTQVKTDDEIGALSRSFDAMAAAVEGKINELSKTTQSQQDFIAAFTHEVKTPMTAMLGYADLMRARPDDTETQREAAGYIYHETQRLENLSRSLLALMGLDQAGAGAGALSGCRAFAADRAQPAAGQYARAACHQRGVRGAGRPQPVGGYAAQPDPQCPARLSGHRGCSHHPAVRAPRRAGGFHRDGYGLRHPRRRSAPRDRGILHGGQVPQPGRRRQRHRAGALRPHRRGTRGKAGNHQHRACRHDRDHRRAGGTAERKGGLQ